MKVALKKTAPQTAEVLRPPFARQAEILVKNTFIDQWENWHIIDSLKETAAKKQMTVSAVTDEMLYRGLVDAGLMEE